MVAGRADLSKTCVGLGRVARTQIFQIYTSARLYPARLYVAPEIIIFYSWYKVRRASGNGGKGGKGGKGPLTGGRKEQNERPGGTIGEPSRLLSCFVLNLQKEGPGRSSALSPIARFPQPSLSCLLSLAF